MVFMQNQTDTFPVLNFSNVGVKYPPSFGSSFKVKHKKGFWALHDITFKLNHGDVLGVIGKNGAGKSTLLKTISGIISHDRGDVNTYNSKITLLALNAGLIPYLSGRKNIILIGLTLGIKKSTILDSMEEIIEYSELEDFIDEPVSTYSTGMKSRLGFSTSIYLKPDIFLIDEILGVGDKKFRKKSSNTIKQLLNNKELTAIVVSHDESTILNLCNKALWIDQGYTKEFGDTRDVVEAYSNHTK